MKFLPCLFLLASCASLVEAVGELSFSRQEQNIKVPADKDSIAVVFPFTNKSQKTITLGKLKPDCECTTATYENNVKKLLPGDSCSVVAVMKTGNFSGKVRKEITVEAEDSAYKIAIIADIPEIIRLNPRQLAWNQGEPAVPKKITITLDPSCPMKLKEVSMSGKGFDFEPVTVKAGKVYEIIIAPKSTEKTTFESVWILTDSPLQRYSKTVSFVSVNPTK